MKAGEAMKKWFFFILMLALSLPVLASCSSSGAPASEPPVSASANPTDTGPELDDLDTASDGPREVVDVTPGPDLTLLDAAAQEEAYAKIAAWRASADASDGASLDLSVLTKQEDVVHILELAASVSGPSLNMTVTQGDTQFRLLRTAEGQTYMLDDVARRYAEMAAADFDAYAALVDQALTFRLPESGKAALRQTPAGLFTRPSYFVLDNSGAGTVTVYYDAETGAPLRYVDDGEVRYTEMNLTTLVLTAPQAAYTLPEDYTQAALAG